MHRREPPEDDESHPPPGADEVLKNLLHPAEFQTADELAGLVKGAGVYAIYVDRVGDLEQRLPGLHRHMGKELLYVGSAVDMRSRLQRHANARTDLHQRYPGTRLYYCAQAVSDPRSIERWVVDELAEQAAALHVRLLDAAAKTIAEAKDAFGYSAGIVMAGTACEVALERTLTMIVASLDRPDLGRLALTGERLQDVEFWEEYVTHVKRRNAVAHSGLVEERGEHGRRVVREVAKDDALRSLAVARELIAHAHATLRHQVAARLFRDPDVDRSD
jgi:hypothetical protein